MGILKSGKSGTFYSNGKSGKNRTMAWTTKDSIKVSKGSTKLSIPKPKMPRPSRHGFF